jgi:hypothetical protein
MPLIAIVTTMIACTALADFSEKFSRSAYLSRK